MTLISQSPAHHVSGLSMGVTHLPSHHPMGDISIHNNIIFLDYGDSIEGILIIWVFIHPLVLSISMIMLSLNHVTAKHLWILNFNLRVVENIIIIIYILNYFYWLILVLFLGFWRSAPSLVRAMQSVMWVTPLILKYLILVLSWLSFLLHCKVIWIRTIVGAFVTLVPDQVPIPVLLTLVVIYWLAILRIIIIIIISIWSLLIIHLAWILSLILILSLIFILLIFLSISTSFLIMLVNYFSWIIYII